MFLKLTDMKAEISQLWETGREIISYEGDEFDRPQSFADLKKCENVLVGDVVIGKTRQVLIDNELLDLTPTTVRHPMGGIMYIIEVE